MSYADRDLVAGDGAAVFVMQHGTRRRVPDTQTLLAIDPRGFAAVRRVAQADLRVIPRGDDVPTVADGTVLVGTDQAAFLVEDGELRRIPDRATFVGLARERVVALHPADIALLHEPFGAPLPSVLDDPASAGI